MQADWELDRNCLTAVLVVDNWPAGLVIATVASSWQAKVPTARSTWRRGGLTGHHGRHWFVELAFLADVGPLKPTVVAGMTELEQHLGVSASREQLARCGQQTQHLWYSSTSWAAQPVPGEFTTRSICLWCEASKVETVDVATGRRVRSEVQPR